MAAIWQAFAVRTTVRATLVQLDHSAWTLTKDSNACVSHGRLHAHIVSRFAVQIKLDDHLQTVTLNLNFFQEQPAYCPCRNGGICVQLPTGSLGCSCRYGYTGDQCERSKPLLYYYTLKFIITF